MASIKTGVAISSPSAINSILSNPAMQGVIAELLSALISAVPGLLAGLLKPKPRVPVTVPTPAPVQEDEDFPDDTIPEPAPKRIVKTVRLKLARAQYNKQRFPDEYKDGKDGLYSPSDLREIEAGRGALNYASKFWLDLTAYDGEGKEFLRPAVLSHGLAYKTEHHAGDSYIKGFGPNEKNADGSPKAEVVDSNEVGNGITAWNSSNGFLHQMKAHGEGEFVCSGSVNGVKSNTFTIKVS